MTYEKTVPFSEDALEMIGEEGLCRQMAQLVMKDLPLHYLRRFLKIRIIKGDGEGAIHKITSSIEFDEEQTEGYASTPNRH